MWRQLTQRARKTIFLAQEEAEKLGYSHVGPEHLLLALALEEDCVADQILSRLGLDVGTIRVEILKNLTRGSDHIGGDMQLTAEAKNAVDRAFAEARQMTEDWVGTEHLLLGLAHEAGGLASTVLANLGVDLYRIREQLGNLKGGTFSFEPVTLRAV